MRNVLMWTAPMLMVAAPVFAQSSDVPTTQGSDVVVKLKKVCRKVEVTGRRIPSSVCHTSDEWAQIDKANEMAAKDSINDLSRQQNLNNGPGVDARGGSSSTGSMMGLTNP